MKSNWRAVSPSAVWSRKHLLFMLAANEIKLRYKQSILGGVWAVIRPLTQMVVFTYLFGSVAKLDSSSYPYSLYVFSALIAWDFFANIVQGCTTSVTSHKVLVEKIYCPRLLFPLSSVLVALFDFSIALLVCFVLMLCLGFMPSINLFYLPLLVLAVIFLGLSVGLWLSAITVWFRDIKFVVSYLLQIVLLITPIGYGSAAIPKKASFILDWNPMSSVAEAFRWAFLGAHPPQTSGVLIAVGVTFVLLFGAIRFFNGLEESFADVI